MQFLWGWINRLVECSQYKNKNFFKIKGEYIEKFNSISDAAKTIESDATIKTRSNRISEACNGKWISAYNFIWKFDDSN